MIDERTVVADQTDFERGRIDRARLGKPNPADVEAYPTTDPVDAEATRAELNELRRRMGRKAS